MRPFKIREDLLTFGRPDIRDEDIREVVDTLKSGWIGPGPKVEQFESGCRKYLGAKHAIAVESGTAALFLAMVAAGIGQEDEVITTPMTYCSTVNAIIHTGAVPVFVDIDFPTALMNTHKIESVITDRTRAVVPVHLYGRPCDMTALHRIAKRHNLVVIQDAAHCFEGWYDGKKIGNMGHMTCFSFHANKNVATAKGGMLCTNMDDWADHVMLLRDCGLTKNVWKRSLSDLRDNYDVKAPGFNYAMTDVHASIGIHHLERVVESLRRRENIWRHYDAAFANLPVVLPAPPHGNMIHARHLYSILVEPQNVGFSRDEMRKRLLDRNVGTSIHYVSLHLMDYYQKRFQFKPLDFPVAESVSKRTLSLPFSAGLSEEDVEYVIHAVQDVFS